MKKQKDAKGNRQYLSMGSAYLKSNFGLEKGITSSGWYLIATVCFGATCLIALAELL